MSTRFILCKCVIVFTLVALCGFKSYAQVNKYEDSSNYNAALAALDKDDIKTGYDYLLKEIAVHPDNGYAYLYLSIIFHEYEDYHAAFNSINNSLTNLPEKDKVTRSKALTVRSKIERVVNMEDAALVDLNEALSLCPKDVDILQERADLYYDLEEFDKSDSDYRRILGLQPGYALAEMGLGRNNVGRERYSDAINQFNKILKKFPDHSQAYSFRAEALIGMGKIHEAMDDILKALEIDQNPKAFVLMSLLGEQSYDIVSQKLERKRDADKNNPVWPYYLGTLREMKEEYLLAISQYKLSFKIKENPKCAKRIADCYREIQDWDNSLSYISKAIALDKDNVSYLADKAVTYWYADRLDKAISQESKCIEIQPSHYFHYYRRGWYKELAGDIDGALEDYTESISLYPEYAYAHMNRGRLYQKRGFDQMANRDFEICVKLDSIPNGNSCAQYALYYLGRTSEAKSFMQEILKNDPDDSFYDAACLYSLMDYKSTALDYLEKAFEHGFNNYNHVLRDSDLENIRGEYRFKQLYEKYSNKRLSIDYARSSVSSQSETPSVEQKHETPEYVEQTILIPFTSSYGITKVKGSINGFTATFSYVPSHKLSISAYQAEYFLKNGYIKKSDISGKVSADEKIPVGSSIKLSSITIGDEVFSNIQAKVVDNNQSPIVFGDKLFGSQSRVRQDSNRKVITVTRNVRSN